ncbi:PMT family glycosyltransferase, 4-amino-4-deoxy-L-arabinose transferase [Caulobacter sp. AP07]|uniref:ArnT family glycosyltransferase n=1 Tax=Caulobacter sp. AP07 TaxID=1144304 RepID=UPI00027215C6|nr:glycosyltransferase family 39 protein [Caulobacter sp. AP07]EJL36751.1 PMT family glycosyltransferase, 4-amino-4-deoxy-L-arabinose transferase [Caulobacter sp. AP07]
MTLESRLDDWSRGWRGPLFAALVALIAGLPGVFAMPPLDRDESRFAQATAQMLETDDLVVIKFQDQPRFKKPVGIHWLQAASVTAFSAPEDRGIWAYRIPSLLGAMLAAAACAWGAAALLGPKTGLLSGAILGATILLSTEAFIAKTDAALCGFTTLAMAAVARIYAAHLAGAKIHRWTKVAFWIGLAMSVLIKGPVGLMVVVLSIAALWIWDRKAPWLKDLGWGWGLILLAGIVLPWATMITVATDGAFWSTAVTGDLAPKLASGQESHGAPFGAYALFAFLLVFPATLLLPSGLVLGWTSRKEAGVRFALCWLIPTWLVFELLPTKLVHYTLPAVPALAMLMAATLRAPLGRISRSVGAVLSALAGLLFAAVAIYLHVEYGDPSDIAWTAVTALLFLAAGMIGAVLLMRKTAAIALVTAGAVCILAHAALVGVLVPRLEPLLLSPRLAQALERTDLAPRAGAAGPVAVTGYSEPSMIFLLGTTTQLTDPAGAAKAVAEGRPAVVEGRQEPAFRAALAALGQAARPAGAVEGFDYSDGDKERLTLYRGAPAKPDADDDAETGDTPAEDRP